MPHVTESKRTMNFQYQWGRLKCTNTSQLSGLMTGAAPRTGKDSARKMAGAYKALGQC